MKIYTKTGDKGETSLYGGSRVSKTSILIDAIGNVDELNASIGFVISAIDPKKFSAEIIILKKIQFQLFVVGSDLASPQNINKKLKNIRIEETDIKFLEDNIDLLDANLEPLNNFILPGGSEVGAQVHLSRAICRRVERSVVYAYEHGEINHLLMNYLNRLSDFLFVFARHVNHELKIEESPWKT